MGREVRRVPKDWKPPAFGHMKGWAVCSPDEGLQSGVAALAEMKSRDKEKP